MSREGVADTHIEEALCGVFPVVEGEVLKDIVLLLEVGEHVMVEA